MTALRQKMVEDMQLRGLAASPAITAGVIRSRPGPA